ncbi:MAG: YaeQ family protein [Bradymonadaceae bacterium]|nr:YaeQ family protein [Lujinxingiaceae bacterium]
MALTSTIYRFQFTVSDVDRSVYESLDVRVACHPSESVSYLLTRVLAYALELRQDLSFGRGLSTPDEPAISAPNAIGGLALWVEIGQPSAAKMHKVCKQADEVRVYTHKDVELVLAGLVGQNVHRAEAVEIVAIPAPLLEALSERLDRKNTWELLRTEETLYVTVEDGTTYQGRLDTRRLDG